MPQSIAVWCRQLGHRVHTGHWGQVDPLSLVPSDVDVILHQLLYSIQRVGLCDRYDFRKRKSLTVIGGPHARSFPTDCTRFFDIVVQNCDRQLIGEILRNRFDPPQVVSAHSPSSTSRQLRNGCLRSGSLHFIEIGQPGGSTRPMLSSLGCPYDCSFCIDWDTKYVTLSTEQLHTISNFCLAIINDVLGDGR